MGIHAVDQRRAIFTVLTFEGKMRTEEYKMNEEKCFADSYETGIDGTDMSSQETV